ncbi:MAG: hypothetical protein HGB20_06390 [Chlorobiaceae bacterium]|nr:hypothetical protein [Chlorobiaceae bacterium]
MAAFDFGSKVDPRLFDHYAEANISFNTGEYIRQAWDLFKEHVGEFLGFTLVIFVASAISSRMNFAGSLVISAVTTTFYAGYAIAAFKILGGHPFQFSDFFRGFNYFLPLFLAGLAGGFLVCIGLILLIVPGIYLGVCYMFTTFLIIDYRMDFWQAMEISRKIISRHWFSFFGFAFVLFAINVLGVLALGIGTFVSIPVSACAAAIAYKDIIGLASADW